MKKVIDTLDGIEIELSNGKKAFLYLPKKISELDLFILEQAIKNIELK